LRLQSQIFFILILVLIVILKKLRARMTMRARMIGIIFERNEPKFCLLNEMSDCPCGDFSATLRKSFQESAND